MAKKKKVVIDEKGYAHFLNDKDGITERDWMIILTSIVFFGGIALGLVFTLVGMFTGVMLPVEYIEIIKTMDMPVGIILGGLFGVKGVQTWVDGRDNTKKKKDNDEDLPSEEDYI